MMGNLFSTKRDSPSCDFNRTYAIGIGIVLGTLFVCLYFGLPRSPPAPPVIHIQPSLNLDMPDSYVMHSAPPLGDFYNSAFVSRLYKPMHAARNPAEEESELPEAVSESPYWDDRMFHTEIHGQPKDVSMLLASTPPLPVTSGRSNQPDVVHDQPVIDQPVIGQPVIMTSSFDQDPMKYQSQEVYEALKQIVPNLKSLMNRKSGKFVVDIYMDGDGMVRHIVVSGPDVTQDIVRFITHYLSARHFGPVPRKDFLHQHIIIVG